MKIMKNMSVVWLVLLSINLPGQSAKKYFQAGEDFFKAKNCSDAIIQFTKAIELKPQYDDAYQKRAEAYECMKKYSEAADDYVRLSAIDTKNSDVYANIGRLYVTLGKNNEAISVLNKATHIKPGNLKAYQSKVLALLNLEKYYDALKVSDSALEIDKNALNYYNHGLVMQKMNSFQKADEDYSKSIKEDKKFIKSYIALANIKVELNKIDDAMKNCEAALKIDPNSVDAFLARSKVYLKRMDYPSAVNDISKIIVMMPENEEYYLIRGDYYQSFKQSQNAINDYSKVLSINPKNAEAYYKRASSYEEVADYKSAMKDYEMLTKFSDDDVKAKKLLAAAKDRLFILNKEDNPPEVVIIDPVVKKGMEIEMPLDHKEIILKGTISDQSPIKFLKINNMDVIPVKHDKSNDFTVSVAIDSTNTFTIAASDVYDNVTQQTYKVKRTEVNPPKVSIIAPIASDNGEIYLSSKDPTLYVEGSISDESEIKSVIIDGVLASYKLDELNPRFSASINIMNKDKFTVTAEDIYGNKSEKVFKFNREGITAQDDNPMGKTWAVFIENADYKTFASLEGPPKDVTLMRDAFSNYKINNVIVKKNMTKEEMDKFFSIELRDLVRSNKVSSLLVWYAGHGKYINEAGYWIPVNANRDDEFTYFNINSLKASLLDYSKTVTHVLVVTDACESGPSFYQAMRSTPVARNCGDWQATKFKSSQVFSSAGYELAVDNSQFTRTFANALKNNPDACIPIENIVSKVTVAVTKNKQQKPKFGKIFGLEDEDGTFFFIK